MADFGDRVWITTPDSTLFNLADGIGLFLGHDRAFTLDVTDITTPAVAWGHSYGLSVLALTDQPGAGEIRGNGAISGDFEFGVVMTTFLDDLTLVSFGEIRAGTAVHAPSLEAGVARILNPGILWGDWAVVASGFAVQIINAPGGLMHGESYGAIHMAAYSGDVTNEGVVEGSSVGIESLGWLQLDNAGTISGGWAALDMSRGMGAQILNSGRLAGLLQGSGWRDEVENAGWTEDVNLGAGADRLKLSAAMTWIGTEAFSGQAGELRWIGQAAWLEADRNGDGVMDWRGQLYNSHHQVTDQDFL